MGKRLELGDASVEDQNCCSVERVTYSMTPIKDEPMETTCLSITGTTAKFHACTHDGCKLTFSRPWRLEAHLRLHKGERPYKCSEEGCTKGYSNNSHLRRHILTTHGSHLFKKKIKCPKPSCSMELSDPNSLKRHIIRKHGQKPDCVCLHCNQGFSRHQELKDHMYQHLDVLPFVCEVCEAGFTRNRLLKRHMRCHKTYTCMEAECGKKFDSWNALRSHVKTGHVAKEFGCNECGKSFIHKSRLHTHLRVHQNPLERPIYTCPYEDCESFYYHSQNLSQHIICTHQGKLHKCPHLDCNRELSTKQKLIDHMKLHDPSPKTLGIVYQDSAKTQRKKAAVRRSLPPKGNVVLHYQQAQLLQELLVGNHFMANTSMSYSNQILDLSSKSSDIAETAMNTELI